VSSGRAIDPMTPFGRFHRRQLLQVDVPFEVLDCSETTAEGNLRKLVRAASKLRSM
jgi:hypothetical protein